mgnify:CR=1 FL=1
MCAKINLKRLIISFRFSSISLVKNRMPETLEKPKVIEEVKTQEDTERQTIVHCTINSDEENYAYRIWPSTFLIERENGRRAKLLTAFNISFAPEWTLNDGKGFTLIFEGLSKGCRVFDLKELIPEAGGFESTNIRRTNNDVYYVKL